jgi:hypothetical protein
MRFHLRLCGGVVFRLDVGPQFLEFLEALYTMFRNVTDASEVDLDSPPDWLWETATLDEWSGNRLLTDDQVPEWVADEDGSSAITADSLADANERLSVFGQWLGVFRCLDDGHFTDDVSRLQSGAPYIVPERAAGLSELPKGCRFEERKGGSCHKCGVCDFELRSSLINGADNIYRVCSKSTFIPPPHLTDVLGAIVDRLNQHAITRPAAIRDYFWLHQLDKHRGIPGVRDAWNA